MHELQNRVDEKLQQDPNVITDFTLTSATGFLASNQGITLPSLSHRQSVRQLKR
jgi:hypothetical protein